MITQLINQTVSNALTAASAQPTKAEPVNTEAWAKWLALDTHGDASLEAMVRACANFTLALRDKAAPRWLSLLGPSGIGKTHCGRFLWKHAAEHFQWHRFEFIHQKIYWPDFVKQLRSGHVYDRLHEMQKWPVLFLDDIGAERDTTGFAAEQLNTLLGSRDGKWTIITSNLSIEQIGGIDPRLADRIIRRPNIFIEVETKSHAMREIESQEYRAPYKD